MPLAGPPSLRRRLAGSAAVRTACGEEGRAEGQRGGGGGAAADEAAAGGSVGGEAGSQFEVDRMFLEGMATVPFVGCERGDRRSGSGDQESSSISSRSSAVGMSAAGRTSDASGAQHDVHLVAGPQHRQVLLGADVGDDRRVVGGGQQQPHHRTLERQILDRGADRRDIAGRARRSTPGRVRDAPSGWRGRPARSWCRRGGPSTSFRERRLRRNRGWRGPSADPPTGWPAR